MAISAGDAVVELGLDTGNFDRGIDGVTGKLDKASSQWGKKLKIAGGVMLGASTAIGGASLKMAADFDSAMRAVNTMMLLDEDEFKALSKDVRGLAKDMGVDAVESANALYQVISAGVPKENAVDFLRLATKAGIAGMTDTKSSVEGLTTVLNAYKLPMSEAQEVSDAMFTTIAKGVTTFPELSANMSTAMPFAAALGVGYKEVLGVLATLTKQGVPTAQAFSQIRASMSSLMTPTAEMTELIKASEYESGEAMLQALGFAGTLDTLTKAAKGDKEVIGKAFSSIEALGLVYGITGDNAKGAVADIDAVGDSAGSTADALVEMEKTTARQFAKLEAQVKDTAMILGNTLMPALIKLLEMVTPIIEKISAWVEKHPKLTAGILATVGAIGGIMVIAGPLLNALKLIAVATKVAAAAQWLMNIAMSANPIGLIIIAVAALIAGIILLVKNWDWVKDKFLQIWGAIGSFFTSIKDKMGLDMSALGEGIRNIWEGIVGFFQAIPSKIKQAFSTLKDIMLAPFRFAIDGIQRAINWLIRQINKIHVTMPGWLGGKTIGFNIPEISLPKFAKGGIIPEPTLLYGLKSMRPYAIAGEKGPEVVSPSGAGVVNNFNIGELAVREEADIARIARELYRMQQSKARMVGA